MQPRPLAVLALAVLLLAVPTAAQAKGATAATIDGGGPGGLPGGPISLRGGGEPGSRTDLGMLAQGTGLYATVFDADPGAVTKAAPTDRLGPRYTITWTFPDPAGGKDRTLRQRVWPYAAGGPVSFTPAGQAVLDTTSSGGWYQGFDGLRAQLIELGLPNRKPLAPAATPAPAAPAPASPQPAQATAPSAAWPRVAAVVAGFLVLVAAAAVPLRRRRLGHGPATAPWPRLQARGAHWRPPISPRYFFRRSSRSTPGWPT